MQWIFLSEICKHLSSKGTEIKPCTLLHLPQLTALIQTLNMQPLWRLHITCREVYANKISNLEGNQEKKEKNHTKMIISVHTEVTEKIISRTQTPKLLLHQRTIYCQSLLFWPQCQGPVDTSLSSSSLGYQNPVFTYHPGFFGYRVGVKNQTVLWTFLTSV